MLKQEISYRDYNDEIQSDVLYFNLSTSELADNLDLKDDLEAIQNELDGEERALTPDEVRSVLTLVKRLMRLSYGIRSEDGKRFKKTPQSEIWDAFSETAAYDAFVTQLFMNPEKAVEFIYGIMPADLRDSAQQQVAAQQTRVIQNAEAREISVDPEPKAFQQPAQVVLKPWEAENRNPTPEEFRKMSPEEQLQAFTKRTSGN